MIIKKKSLIVTMVSGFVLSCVLILTLIGYIAYIELKNEESKRSYHDMNGRLNAAIYGKYVEIIGLEARSGASAALRGKNIIEGTLKNRGDKDIAGIIVKIKFFDRSGAIIYETVIDPLEPALGLSGIPPVKIPYISVPSGVIIRKGDSIPFKKVLHSCPDEITYSINSPSGFSKDRGKWPGNIGYELLSAELFDSGA